MPTLFKGIVLCKTKADYDALTKDPDTLYIIEDEAPVKLYHGEGQNTDGAIDQKVVTDALAVKADLVDGKVPSTQLPAFVDDVLEFPSLSSFPATGESGKIYVALDTNKTYRWSGSTYVEISPSIALGETESTAYRGDRGKIAYDHTSRVDNPHNVTKAQLGLQYVDNTRDEDKPVSVPQQTAIDDAVAAEALLRSNAISAEATARQTADNGKVSKSGDTMTGSLTIPTPNAVIDDMTAINAYWANHRAQVGCSATAIMVTSAFSIGSWCNAAFDASLGELFGDGASSVFTLTQYGIYVLVPGIYLVTFNFNNDEGKNLFISVGKGTLPQCQSVFNSHYGNVTAIFSVDAGQHIAGYTYGITGTGDTITPSTYNGTNRLSAILLKRL